MNIQKIEKLARIFLILSFLSPLLGFVVMFFEISFNSTSVPSLAGATPLLLGLFNLPFVILSALFYAVATLINQEKHLQASGYLLITSMLISVLSIAYMTARSLGELFI